MTSPILALRRAVLDIAAGDQDLIALMGGALQLYDEPPRGATGVYALFGDVTAEDWSTDFDRGYTQNLTIVVWGERGSARDALSALERLSVILDDADLDLAGHRLVNLRVTAMASARDRDSQRIRATLRLRAVTETA
ncbi:DUF3168 domain-containing protein [Microvirga antarctica]|uniref:DUF3168 domain-containing protein n=1 Tax=Microvirga antarctica TaxID=2819233 RepID=UPI001B30C702|nr:DUF3168 domain-containing protein [Microvirga antarctica]